MRSKPVNSVFAVFCFPILLASGSLWAQLSFTGHDFAVENGPASVVVGGFIGDGIQDLAVANTLSNHVSVLLGNGDGTFLPAVSYPVGTSPSSIAVGYFASLTVQDLVVANRDSNDVSVLLGNGDGTFQTAVNYPAGNSPVFVAVGNFASEGRQDLVVADSVCSPPPCQGSVSVLLVNFDGTFQAPVSYPTGDGPWAVAVGDFNGDGAQDLAVLNLRDFYGLSVLLGNGDGTFQSAHNYSGVGSNPRSVAVGDFNGDGNQDLAIAAETSQAVTVMLGNGDGTFGDPVQFLVGAPVSVAVGDFDGDGIQDLAVAIYRSTNVGVLLGNGDGTFQPPVFFSSGGSPYSVAVGEFDADFKTDLAVANGVGDTVTVLINDTP